MSNSTLCLQYVEAVAMEMGGVLMEAASASPAFKQMITAVSTINLDYLAYKVLSLRSC